jgi:hypothetical protein
MRSNECKRVLSNGCKGRRKRVDSKNIKDERERERERERTRALKTHLGDVV